MVITRVAPLSAAKVVAVLYVIIGLIFGGLMTLMGLAGAFAAADSADAFGPGAFFGAMFGVGSIILLPILYGCFGFVMTLISAWLYNIVSGVVGGVEIDVR